MLGTHPGGMRSLDYEPEHREKLLKKGQLRTLGINRLRRRQRNYSSVSQPVLQVRCKLIDIGRGNVDSHGVFEKRGTMPAHEAPWNLNHQALNGTGLIF